MPEPQEVEHVLSLSPEADRELLAFRDEVEVKLRPGGEYSDIEDWAGKFAGHVLRIAAALDFYLTAGVWKKGGPLPWEVSIDGPTMQKAIAIGYHYVEHAKVAYAVMTEGGRTYRARRLLANLGRQGVREMSLRDLWRGVRRGYNDLEELRSTLRLLEEHHYVQVIEERPGPAGGRTTTRILLNPLWRGQTGDIGDNTVSLEQEGRGSVTNVTKSEQEEETEWRG